MSVTVEDLLRLPSLRGAELVAGQGAGKKLVSSISVLEYADPSVLQAELFRNNEFFGSEIVITGFMNIPRDVEAQCANLRRLADAGEVGLILFYVGVFMPEVDPKLMALADEKDFALIVMPRGRMDLRYSDVICEVMEAIFKDQNDSGLLVSDILGRTALLPEHQRTLDTVLKLLSDRLRATVLLTDGALRPLNAVPWPRAEDTRLPEALRSLEALPVSGGAPGSLQSEGRSYTIYRQTLSSGPALELFLLKEGAPLPPDLVRRAGEVVHLASSIWSQGHGRVVMSELVRAILRDEPVKMRRLAELFHVDVASIHSMWLLHGDRAQAERFRREALPLSQETLAHTCRTLVADYYEERRWRFVQAGQDMVSAFFKDELSMLGPGVVVLGLIVALFLAGILLAKGARLRARGGVLLAVGLAGFVGYNFVLRLSYAFIFREEQCVGLVDYNRYIYPYYIGLFLIALAWLLAAAQSHPAPQWRGLAAGALVLALGGGMLLRTNQFILPQYSVLGFSQAEFDDQNLIQRKADAVAETVEPGSRIFFVSQGDNGLRWFSYSCDLLPLILDYSGDIDGGGGGGGTFGLPELDNGNLYYHPYTLEEFRTLVEESGCAYILVDAVDEIFVQSYGSLFADGLAGAEDTLLYRVTEDGWQPVEMEVPR